MMKQCMAHFTRFGTARPIEFLWCRSMRRSDTLSREAARKRKQQQRDHELGFGKDHADGRLPPLSRRRPQRPCSLGEERERAVRPHRLGLVLQW